MIGVLNLCTTRKERGLFGQSHGEARPSELYAMPRSIQFVFWAYGDETYTKRAISIDDLHCSVYELKHAIMKKLELQPDRVGYSYSSLDLWKVIAIPQYQYGF